MKKKISAVLVIGLAGMGLSSSHVASAGSTTGYIFETLGVSTAVGAVLGASTLPFYEVPGDHLVNLSYGALAGLGVGIGILIAEWVSPSAAS